MATDNVKSDDCGCGSLVSEGGISGTHPVSDSFQNHLGPTTEQQFNTLRSGLLPVACWRVDDLRFEFDSSFIGAGIAAELMHLRQLIQDHPPSSKSDPLPGCPLSIFGHADPTGSDDYNKQLSGRRAAAIYALLTRNTGIWEKLYSQPLGNDNWGKRALETMLNNVSPPPAGETNQNQASHYQNNPGERQELFEKYMDKLCGRDFKLEKGDFLGKGQDKGGKGDYHGCSEFNPALILSEQDEKKFTQDSDKTARNAANAINRRVMVLIFRKGSQIDPALWPCPRVSEGVAGCKKRFWSDGESRRSRQLPNQPRKYKQSKDTFACRFYDRLLKESPCEITIEGDGIFYMQCLAGDGQTLLANRKYSIQSKGGAVIRYQGQLDETGTLRHVNVPHGDYLLNVDGCAEGTPIAVLRLDEEVPQVQLLESGRLAIHVLTPYGDAIPGALVSVQGLGDRESDEDGIAYFNSVHAGDYSFKAAKTNYIANHTENTSMLRLVNNQGLGAIKSENNTNTVNGEVEVKDRRADVIVTMGKNPAPVLGKILRITGKQPGTHGVRSKTQHLGDNQLSASASSDMDLNTNKPVILLRGSRSVFLCAVTDPPGQIVDWDVVPNQSASAPPDFAPKNTIGGDDKNPDSGTWLEIQTNQVGSFAAVAKLNGASMIWNFVLVGVEIDTASTSVVNNNGFMDLNKFLNTPEGKKWIGTGMDKTYDPTKKTGVVSGVFEFGKFAWSSLVKVHLKGGGPSGTLGCDQIQVHIIQNLHHDHVRGIYETKLAYREFAEPTLDTSQGSPPNYFGPVVGVGLVDNRPIPQCPFIHAAGMIRLNKNDPAFREIEVGDSPGTGFNTTESGENLKKIDKDEMYRVGLVSFSNHSKNSIVAHADLFWKVDYTGKVSVDSLIGAWSNSTAKVEIVYAWKPILSSSGVQGDDAGDARFEIFPPLAAKTSNESIKIIDLP